MTDLVKNIYRVVTEGAEVADTQVNNFGSAVGEIIAQRLAETKNGRREFTLRMSNIGKGARQLWYDKRFGNDEKLPPSTIIKFMFGDIIEQLVLFLAEVAGHKVTNQQAEVDINGIKGHIDADIDGVTIDVKSASTHSFRKFADGTLAENDSFGYVEQLSGYCQARDTTGAFIAVDKQNGHIAYLPIERLDVSDRIEYLKDALEAEDPPERCYSDAPEGASGNRSLGINCSYCSHKFRCWADANDGLGLRSFSYSNGPKYLTKVVVEPRVREEFPTK